MKTVCIAALAMLASVIAFADSSRSSIPFKPWRINQVEGRVYLNGQLVQPSGGEFPTITGNSIISTEEGRIELQLAPGITLRLHETSAFRMITNIPSDTQVELLAGSAVVITDDRAKHSRLKMVCEDAVTFLSSGSYGFETHDYGLPRFDFTDCHFKVYRGSAEVQLLTVKFLLKAGQMTQLERGCGDHIGVNGTFDTNEPLENR
jgi:hypothetical protein